ncbi:MAG: ketopantoate reductase C-terminal domain-containing protein, partial [Burkholderiaceae bacterium]
GGRAVFVCNGIPWWWRYHGPAEPGSPLPLLDPGAALWKTIRPERAIGCVVYSGNEVIRPGVIHHTAGNRWLLGDPAPGISPETREITEVMRQAGLRTDCVDDIRAEVWQKLLRNAPLNTMCALTRLPVDGLARDPQLWALYDAVVDEVVAIAAACGTDLSASVRSARLKAIPSGSPPTIPEIRPSMLQDVLAGRPMEVAAILEQVQAFGRETGTASPRLDVLTALLAGLDRANDSLSGNQA